jgi:hypothetical protein
MLLGVGGIVVQKLEVGSGGKMTRGRVSTINYLYLVHFLHTELLAPRTMTSSGELPAGLSGTYWRTWAPRAGLSVNESLDNGEEWIGSWDGVGLYEQ